MTNEKIAEAAAACKDILIGEKVAPKQFPSDHWPELDEEILAHAHFMLDEIINVLLPANRRDKAFRWLGFVQGILWSVGLVTIDELKNQNRSDDPAKV